MDPKEAAGAPVGLGHDRFTIDRKILDDNKLGPMEFLWDKWTDGNVNLGFDWIGPSAMLARRR